jgi:hypothetical protein
MKTPQIRKSKLPFILLISLLVFFVLIGFIYPTSVLASQHKTDGEGFLSDVDPENNTSALRVISTELARSDVPSGGEIEVRVIVANYGNETKNNVTIKPQLYDRTGSLANDKLNLSPKDQYNVKSFEQGEIKTFTFLAQFNHDPANYPGKSELVYDLRLSGANGDPVTNIKPAVRTVTVVKSGSSSTGTSFINRRPISLTTFNLDAFKDETVSQKDVPGSTIQIPPVEKDQTGAISNIDVANGQVTSFGAISETDTRNSGVVSTGDGNLSVGFAFENIPEKSHYLFRLAHDDTQISDPIEINVVDSTGDEIDPNTTYQIPESDGGTEQFDFHLSSKEVSQIQTQGDSYIVMRTMNKTGSVATVDINKLYYLSLIGVNQVVNLPDPELQVEDINVVDSNYELEQRGGIEMPTYNPNEEMIFNISIRNIGDSSYVGGLELRELLRDFTGSRDSVDRVVINPNETRHIEFRATAERSGVHQYTLNSDDLCSEDLDSGTECPLSVQVRGGNGEIVPRIETENESVIEGVKAQYRLTGVYSSDDRIQEIRWKFEDSVETYNPENGVVVEHTYSSAGEKAIRAEVVYDQDGETKTAEHSILVDVIELPNPDIKAVYYDIKTTDRTSVRSGEEWGEGIGGQIMSKSCSNSCGGKMNIGDVNPQMTEGMSMMVIDKNFESGSPRLEFYGTYDFERGKYATTSGLEFNNDLSDVLNDGNAEQKFINDVNEQVGEQKIFIFAGGGDPSSSEVSSFLSSIGAKFGGYDQLQDNSSYTLVTEVVDSGGSFNHVPVHESYLPSATGEPLQHTLQIVPVEASNSDVPKGREVYFEVQDERGSDFYDNSGVSYEWTGGVKEVNEGSYAYKQIDTDTEVGVSISGIADIEQSDSETILTDDKTPSMKALSTDRNIENGSSSVITAAYSYDPDGIVSSDNYRWSVNSPAGTSVKPSETDGIQSLVVDAGDVQGTVTANLLRDGVVVDTASINIIGETNSNFEVRRVPGLIDYNKDALSSEDRVIYDHGAIGSEVGVSELDLSNIASPVRNTFGKGEVEFRENSIFMKANARPGPYAVDAITDTSASRFIQTGPIDMNNYDSIYVSYKRTFERGLSSGNIESGYISMHLEDINQDKFVYGNKGTLRGSSTEAVMTSDVVTKDSYNERYGVMELDVSDVTGERTVTVHLRAHGTNEGISKANIYELWGSESGSIPSTSSLFDNNFYPDSDNDLTDYGRSRNGFATISLDDEDTYIDSRLFSSSIVEAKYNISEKGSSSYRITTGGNDISQSTFSDTVSTETPGSVVSFSTSDSQQPVLVDNLRVSSDRENTNNNLVLLDGGNSQAIESDDYTWSVDESENVDIHNRNRIETIAEFDQVGEYDVTLEVENERSSDQITKTIEVGAVDPEVDLNVQSNIRLGQPVSMTVEVLNDVSVDEITLLLGNGNSKTLSSPGEVEYTYDNPGKYEITAVVKTSDGLTSASSKNVKVDTDAPEVVEEEYTTTVMLPQDILFDPTGTVENVSSGTKIVDLSSIIQDERDMEYTWTRPDGTTESRDTIEYSALEEGNETINLQVSTPSGAIQNISIEVQGISSEPNVRSFEIESDSIFGYEPFASIYKIDHENGVDGNVSIITNDTVVYRANFSGDTSEVAEIDMNDVNINPGDLPSSYEFTVEVTDQFGNSDQENSSIYVNSSPLADFEFVDIEDGYVVGRSETLDASNSKESYDQELNYTWTFGVNNTVQRSGGPTLTHVFEKAGDLPVELEVTDANGDTDTITKNVTVSSAPNAVLVINRTDIPKQFIFDASDSSVGGINNSIQAYRLDVDGDEEYEKESSTPQITHNYSTSESYPITLQIVDKYGYSDTDTKSLDVISKPDAMLNISETTKAGEFVFDGSGSTAGGINNSIQGYRLDVDGDEEYEKESSTPQITHNYSNEGTYEVGLKVKDEYGYMDTISKSITVDLGLVGSAEINTCGNNQGRLGPTQSECDNAYAGTELEGMINVYDNGLQELEVPRDGIYRIKVAGAGYSGSNQGRGAIIEDAFNLTEGQLLQMVVGQKGYNNGGAGGTFVSVGDSYSTSEPLIVAGGAGGGYHSSSNASTGTSGNDGYGSNSGVIPGGTRGDGGSGVDGTGGGGFYTDGEGGADTSQGGYAFRNGAMGAGANVNDAYGGFGGGGVTEDGGDEPAGGGGYSGGGGSDDDPPEKAGGGGSYSTTSNPIKNIGNTKSGYIEIEYVGKSDNIPVSCMEYKENGHNTSGFYTIYPNNNPSVVYCDMEYDSGGWTRVVDWDATSDPNSEFWNSAQWDAGSNTTNTSYSIIYSGDGTRSLLYTKDINIPNQGEIRLNLSYEGDSMEKSASLFYGVDNTGTPKNLVCGDDRDGYTGGYDGPINNIPYICDNTDDRFMDFTSSYSTNSTSEISSYRWAALHSDNGRGDRSYLYRQTVWVR